MANFLKVKGSNEVYRQVPGGYQYVSDPNTLTAADWGNMADTDSKPLSTQDQINLATPKPITPQDTAGFQATAKGIYDPQRQANTTDVEARLKQTLAAGDQNIQQDLSSRGFLRSGEQITRSDIQRTVAEADALLSEQNYNQTSKLNEQSYAEGLQTTEAGNRKTAADTAFQNQVTAAGINQQEFANMQTDLTNKRNTVTDQTALLTNASFTDLLTSYPELAYQLLQQLGFQVS